MPKVEDSKIGAVVSWLFLLGLFVLCWYWGFQIGATSLTDPDTCWLLAVGRWILSHGALPQSDPFSWTQYHAIPGNGAYVPYQWLASLIFYSLYSAVGAKGLLLFVSTLVLAAFLLLPLVLARKLGVSLWLQAMLSVLAVSAGSFHFPLRPELFSYLLIAILLCYLLQEHFVQPTAGPAPPDSQSQTSKAKAKARVLLNGLQGLFLFTLWANLHSGFALGLVIVLLTCLFSALATIFTPAGYRGKGYCLGRLLVFFGGALVGSLITPFQFRLYAYLPELFFSPTNKFNQELLPLSGRELLSQNYQPFLILQLLFIASLVALVLECLRPKSALPENGPKALPVGTPPIWFTLTGLAVLTFVLFASGDLCRRMIPFAVLISFSYFIAFAKSAALERSFAPFKKLSFLRLVLEKMDRINQSFNRFFVGERATGLILFLALVFVWCGTQASSSIFPVSVPQSSPGFDVPWQAVDFVQRNRPPGNLFNDPQFGDVLILSLDEKARVFIDTRFDLYGPSFCRDYFTMANGLSGYEKLLESYKIDWIFFPPRAPIVAKLGKCAGWRTVLRDNAAVIMVRQKGGTQ
jgi:hypothetical protein